MWVNCNVLKHTRKDFNFYVIIMVDAEGIVKLFNEILKQANIKNA